MELPYFNPFTWSMRRREMLQRCPREYFYHYYASAGGAFIRTFTLRAEKLHLSRNLLSTEEYLRKILYTALRKLFNSGAAVPGPFQCDLEERVRRDFRNMLLGKPGSDHKLPLLRELTMPGSCRSTLEEKLMKDLKSQCEFFERILLAELLNIPPASRCPLPFPLKICWNALDCFTTPLAAWCGSGYFHLLCAGAPSEENAALLALYALEKYRIPPENVRIFHIDSKGIFSIPLPRSFSEALRRIREDADRMLFLELRLKSGTPGELIFPQEPASCSNCRFRTFCT